MRVALGGISEWFDEYIATEEADPGEVRMFFRLLRLRLLVFFVFFNLF